MTPRTLDVPELSTIEPTETLAEYHHRVRPAKPARRWRVVLHTLTSFRN